MDVEFAIVCDKEGKGSKQYATGDVQILVQQDVVREIEVKTGGIHCAGITNPCQEFSLAGRLGGHNTKSGQLFHDCVTAVRAFEKSSDMPMYLAENVRSSKELDFKSDAYLPHRGSAYFLACGSMVAASRRVRKFATNRPPVECINGPRVPGQPPSLDGDRPEVSAKSVLRDSRRLVHPDLKKLATLTHSGPMRDKIWEHMEKEKEPVATALTPEEAERAMGYSESEVGITAYSARKAVEERIQNHNYERDGCLISLKGCADQKDLIEEVDDRSRLELLGNSQVVTLLEALMWNERRLFPAAKANSRDD